MLRRSLFAITAISLLSLSSRADVPCELWASGGVSPGVTGSSPVSVSSSVYWNGSLVISGSFFSAGGVAAFNLAKWNGENWTPVGAHSGIFGKLTTFQGRLIVGGSFSTSGLNRIAAWDGGSWQSLGEGFDGPVTAVGVYNGELIASGNFSKSGVTLLPRIARWDGISWKPLGGGLSAGASSFAVYGNELIAAGSFWTVTNDGLLLSVNNIARWNGTSWSALGSGFSSGATSTCVVSGILYAGGGFSSAGPNGYQYIAQWDGSAWMPVGTGTNNAVYSMAEFGGSLYIAGGFTSAGGLPASKIASWDGQSWKSTPDVFDNWFLTLCATEDRLFGGGYFSLVNDLRVNRVAAWDGSKWECLGSGFLTTNSVFSFGESLIVSGGRAYAGATTAGLHTWNGRDWSVLGPLGSSPTGSLAYAIMGGNLVACGYMPSRGTNCVAQWDGASWSALGGETVGDVKAFAVYQNQLFAAGDFTSIGGRSIYSFARWDGAAWQSMGLTRVVGINALCVNNGLLYVGGTFDSAIDKFPSARVAAWNGASLVAVGEGVGGFVNCLGVFEGDLVAGGDFTAAGGQPASRVARWTGTDWLPLGAGLDASVNAMVVQSSKLYAGLKNGGTGAAANRVAVWDGTSWSSVGTGTSAAVTGLISHKGELAMIGDFTSAGGLPASRLARYSDTGEPRIYAHPESQEVGCQTAAQFFCVPATGYSGLTYAWRKDGEALMDSLAIAGSTTNTLTITGVSEWARGSYDCVVSTSCAASTTAAAQLELLGACCPTDLNGDAATDDSDFVLFLHDYNILDCDDLQMPHACPADFNRDSIVDDADFVIFIAAYNELLCS
ncbi:MAG: hypothetical protein ACREJD_16535 [Phycisphaerales bacterium]